MEGGNQPLADVVADAPVVVLAKVASQTSPTTESAPSVQPAEEAAS